ncbi:alpha/beta hydrolase [Dysgonomonas sp. Marseille-P4677]|uniref:alpha/beta hydrolase n=1 Tax=Dysgonomonas sp. Marseille-P4677 TaxID=2364790 RepID=UPI001912344C|nr:alpha/beta hydrolase [Dysgonomonas sp. Marseille-P4677]MBK5722514.1 alpha/beta hydrolase [Dysgonomonas sp. Marseille-P4677]
MNIPILIIQGTNDIQVSTEQAELLTKGNPRAKKVIIKKMNHIMKESDSLDQHEQIQKSYNNSVQPISKDIIKNIAAFINE